MLEAAPGDHIAIIHLENGHTTLPQNQPKKPLNRGTVFLYGTSQPKEEERLFDVHLVWNKQGTGGDGRGRLLATRNYDDGQCYQPNSGSISMERATKLASEGAQHDIELGCQSTLQLPTDLKPGSIYTIYWYWDWPDLNADAIDFQATTNGLFPWAGTFMRGEKDPHGFTMAAIAKNESYASTIDIKITAADPQAATMGSYVDDQDIYTKALKSQMDSNFEVAVDANGGKDATAPGPPPAAPIPSIPSSGPIQPPQVAPISTVTSFTTMQPTITTTRYGTQTAVVPSSSASLNLAQPGHTVTKYITVHVPASTPPASTVTATIYTMETVYKSLVPVNPAPSTVFVTGPGVPAATPPGNSPAERPTTTLSLLSSSSSVDLNNGRPTVTPFIPGHRRRDWAFGRH
ncbi:hypothetical protein BBK36DRAFT_1112994 [Trichoderma citrinoviride]|uniref:DUF7492 domain-containing protein n=1 Tax=Trichoderma citrinoviride TaxID=58853 RepID=A0A2T4BHU7_9HYPO|nr:hypothetical protein BBK36DRAFT_1112994 [Trichoderma citrinoviride]PTB68880.1 hypothetical protein BBK36DRAFT_1112994 [Trichoderma citrinoviride]